MSIIVKGMEMPNTCEECQESCEIGSDLFCLVVNDGNKWGWKKSDVGFYMRPDWCPLRPLPKKHGRLIEAERLRAEFPYSSEGMGGWRNPDEALVHKTDVWAAIDCAETIVEAEGE